MGPLSPDPPPFVFAGLAYDRHIGNTTCMEPSPACRTT
jgi:hypothetical protein